MNLALPEIILVHGRLSELLHPVEWGEELAHNVEVAGVGRDADQLQCDLLQQSLGSGIG
jgi:hypothetical protein